MLGNDLAGPESGHDEDEEEFVYPDAPLSDGIQDETRQIMQEDVQQGVQENGQGVVPRPSQPPSPAQLESLYAAATSGDLPLLKQIFQNALRNGEVEPFSLANNASSRTGFTALHAAASRGYLDMVTWRKSEHLFVCHPS